MHEASLHINRDSLRKIKFAVFGDEGKQATCRKAALQENVLLQKIRQPQEALNVYLAIKINVPAILIATEIDRLPGLDARASFAFL